jgi:hypothetical protein
MDGRHSHQSGSTEPGLQADSSAATPSTRGVEVPQVVEAGALRKTGLLHRLLPACPERAAPDDPAAPVRHEHLVRPRPPIVAPHVPGDLLQDQIIGRDDP